MTRFAGSRVLITGAGSGRLMAAEVATRGAHAILWDIDAPAVAERIVRAIRKNRVLSSSYLFRIFPTALFDAVMRVLGVSHSMDDFTGRNPEA